MVKRKGLLKQLYRDEGGDVLQNIMILGVAAVILLFITNAVFPQMRTFVMKHLQELVKFHA